MDVVEEKSTAVKRKKNEKRCCCCRELDRWGKAADGGRKVLRGIT